MMLLTMLTWKLMSLKLMKKTSCYS